MRSLRRFLARATAAGFGRRDEVRLSEEIEEHIALQTADHVRAGMAPEEARRQAVLKFGGVEAVKDECRDQAGFPVFENLLRDTRFALRQLRKSPVFTATAIVTLALGICSAVAIFAFVDGVLVKPLPYRNPARLVGVYEKIPLCPRCNLSYSDYLDYKRLNTVFESMEAYRPDGFSLSTPEGAEQVSGGSVTAGFFRTLGIRPVLGRDFQTGDDQPQAPPTVLLNYGTWKERFGGRRDILGQTLTLSGVRSTIIGILPREFHFAPVQDAQFWSALRPNPSGFCDTRRSCHNLYGVARLKDGISVQTALANIQSVAQALEKLYPDSNRGQAGSVESLTEVMLGEVRPILLVLLGGAALLLIIAAVNVASLLLVRSEIRKREVAVRAALGGSRARLFWQFATEGIVLTAVGAALGLASAKGFMRLLLRLIPQDLMARMPFLDGLGFSPSVLAFAAALSLAAATLFSFAPTLRLSLGDLRDGLAEGGRGAAGRVWRRFGAKLVVVELATAVILLAGAGLLSRSLYRLLQVDLGFVPDNLATLLVAAPMNSYMSEPMKAIVLEKEIMRRVATLPGAESMGITSRLPLLAGNTLWIRVVGRAYHGEHDEAAFRQVSTAYFSTLKARLLRGRYFIDEDNQSKPGVVIIDQKLASKYFPAENPVGRKIEFTHVPGTPSVEIVGVVGDIKEGEMDKDSWPTLYVPFDQNPSGFFSLVVRVARNAPSLLPALAATIHRIDPAIATFRPGTMRQRINDAPAAYLRRSSAWLVGAFALVALLLSVVGMYGVIAYSVSQRTREIGVRIALGAQPKMVYRLVFSDAARLTAAGLAIGLVLSVGAASLIRGVLFGVKPWDAGTLALVAAVLGSGGLLASLVPARSAASVDPVEALRAE